MVAIGGVIVCSPAIALMGFGILMSSLLCYAAGSSAGE
jgi:hypothetical protein